MIDPPVLPPTTIKTKPDGERDVSCRRLRLTILVGMALSSLLVWLHAANEEAHYGGEPVQMSIFGQGLFLVMGACLGIAVGLVFGNSVLAFAESDRVPPHWRTAAAPMIAGVLVSALAVVAYFFLMMTIFFSIPDALFRMMYAVPGNL